MLPCHTVINFQKINATSLFILTFFQYASIETCDDNPDDFASRLWAPNSDTEVERFWRNIGNVRKSASNKRKSRNKKTLPDSEEALDSVGV